MRPFRAVPLLLAVPLIVLAPAASAHGAGGVSFLDASSKGIASGDGSRYVAFPGSRDTVVAQLDASDAQVQKATRLPGRMVIPAVAYDSSPGGLAADGETLVLFRQTYSSAPRRSLFAVIDTERLRTRLQVSQWVRLGGAFTFDAISPDGETMYLIHYLKPARDPSRYEVRAFDLESGRLLPGEIVDPEEPGEEMAGLPLTRATSPDGRWAYTLYDGVKHEPFIHALDTTGRRAVCIDLPQLEGRRDLFQLGLESSGSGPGLTVVDRRGRPQLVVDTETFEVSPPASRSATDVAEGDGAPPWLLIGLALGAFVTTVALSSRSAPKPPASDRALEELPEDPEVLEPAARE